MRPTSRPDLVLRATVLLAGSALLLLGTWWLVCAPVRDCVVALRAAGDRGPGSIPFQTVVVGACAFALLTCVVWAVATTLLSVAGLLAGELALRGCRTVRLVRQAERHCPAPVRRLAATALGVTLGAGIAVPALATADPPPRPLSLSGLALPDRTTGVGLAKAARPAIGGQASTPRSRYVDVRPGDSLWRIAQSLLGAAATDVEITRAWHRIHRLNLDRIGTDPDLIRPGTRLTVPPLAHRKETR